MKDPISPQDGTTELKEQLAKSGIKVPQERRKRRNNDTLNKVGGSIQVNNTQNPNSTSSYNGIFG